MTEADKLALQYEDGDRIKYFCVLTIPENAEDMTVNLKAPVAINLDKGTASQLVLQDKELQVRHPAYRTYANVLAAIDEQGGSDSYVEEVWSHISIQDGGQTVAHQAAV